MKSIKALSMAIAILAILGICSCLPKYSLPGDFKPAAPSGPNIGVTWDIGGISNFDRKLNEAENPDIERALSEALQAGLRQKGYTPISLMNDARVDTLRERFWIWKNVVKELKDYVLRIDPSLDLHSVLFVQFHWVYRKTNKEKDAVANSIDVPYFNKDLSPHVFHWIQTDGTHLDYSSRLELPEAFMINQVKGVPRAVRISLQEWGTLLANTVLEHIPPYLAGH